MAKFKKLLWALAVLPFMTGCSDDAPGNGNTDDNSVGIYARLALSLPTSRSQTTDNGNSDAGYEVGQDYENKVRTVLVVLADKNESTLDYTLITSALSDAEETGSSTATTPIYSLTFELDELEEFAGKEVYVFAYCNPSMTLINQIKELGLATDKSINLLAGDIENTPLSNKDNFLMSNSSLATVVIPDVEKLLKNHNTPDHPFNLGTVDVSRATARFDFRETTYENQTRPNRYPIIDTFVLEETDSEGNITTTTTTETMGYVTLDGMALMNEAINFYYLPSVSQFGMPTGSSLCGAETNSNYVVSPNAAGKMATLTPEFMTTNYLYSGVSEGATQVTPYDFSNFTYEPVSNTGRPDDNDENWTADNKEDYHIWKYVSENTIPGDAENDGVQETNAFQRLGVTTCIVFRGFIEAVEGSPLAAMMEAGSYIYSYNGKLIGDLATLKEQVKNQPISSLADAFYSAAAANGNIMNEDGTINPDNVTADFQKTGITERGEGLKIFKPEDGKYYCYYIYRNRHNDNLLNTKMGPMEFGVVRNNVYKIDVASILEFGHTKNPNDDPDPEDPNTPDEPNKAYFRLQVRVLPWVVRVNHVTL